MPDTVAEMARKSLKKSGKLNFDPAAYTAGYAEGIRVASQVVREALEKFVTVKA